MDYIYTLAKIRHQEKLNEANAWRRLRAARTQLAQEQASSKSTLLSRLGDLFAIGTRLQMQSK